MRYIMSDIHGCYEEYCTLLDNLGFDDEDELYVLGDAMDRGPESIQVMQDLMCRPNVYYILGNHDLMFLETVKHLGVEMTQESMEAWTEEARECYQIWINNGGQSTVEQFLALPPEQRQEMVEYVKEAALYETLEWEGCLYVLVHAGIGHFSPHKELDEYEITDFVWERTDYSKQYFPSQRIRLVTGHTPTPFIRADQKPRVYEGNGHIAVDCGCVFGGRLAAYCLETGKTAYVKSQRTHS